LAGSPAYRVVPVFADQAHAAIARSAIDPNSVTVAGAQSIVERVMAAMVSLPAQPVAKAASVEAKPVPVDSALNPVVGLAVVPPFVRVIFSAGSQRGSRGYVGPRSGGAYVLETRLKPFAGRHEIGSYIFL